jgi:hypothetical protein
VLKNPSPYGTLIHVDLNLPDQLLIKQFESRLSQLRKDIHSNFLALQSRTSMESFSKYAVLPYLDLSIWAEQEKISIPNRVMADAIFPLGEGGEENIRKTTKPLSKQLLTDDSLNRLAAYAALEIAERNPS